MAPSFPHWALGKNLLPIPPSPLSRTVTALSQGCCFPCRCLLILPGCEQPFLLHTWELRTWKLCIFGVQLSLGTGVGEGFAGKCLTISSKSDCRTPPSSSSFILACPSLAVQATTLFLSPLCVSFLSLQLGGH